MHRFLALTLLFGCPVTDGGDKPEGDADTDADSDTDTDTDVDLGPCPAYTGLTAQGRSYTYRYNDEQAAETGPGTWTTTLTALGVDGAWTTQMEATYEVEGFDSYTSSSTSTGGCDAEGAWMASTETTITYVFGGHETVIEGSTTYSPPYYFLPPAVTEGDRWTIQVAGTTESSSAPPSDFDYELTIEAVATTSVTVPAGTFTTLEFESSSEFGSFTYWADASVGQVETEVAELVSYE